MSENGEIYTVGKNFTLPPALTAWTNSTSGSWYRQVAHCWAEEKNIKGKFCNVCRCNWLSIVFNIILGIWSLFFYQHEPSHRIISLGIGIAKNWKLFVATIFCHYYHYCHYCLLFLKQQHHQSSLPISTKSRPPQEKAPRSSWHSLSRWDSKSQLQWRSKYIHAICQFLSKKTKSHQSSDRVDVSMKSIARDRGAFPNSMAQDPKACLIICKS